MSRNRIALALVAVVTLLTAASAFAGAKLKIDDESSIDFGFRVQTQTIVTDELDGTGKATKTADWKVRRGRLRVKGMITPDVEAFIQTDVGGTDNGAGQSARVIDAFVTMKADPWAQVIMGLNMSPANRQNVTSSGTLMCIDRPGLAYKSLSWGGRMLRTFSNNTISGTASGLAPGVSVRELGVTLFGSGKVGEKASLKYYVGAYDGVNASGSDATTSPATTLANGEDTPLLAARAQLNFYDAEAGYYNSSTYLGKKKIVAIGASAELQTDVSVVGTVAAPVMVDYHYYSADVFVEWPVEDGALTFEGAWMMLDLDDAAKFMAAQGNGFYAQAGYFIQNWQPWAGFETWASDGVGGVGNVDQFRFGVTKFLKGHNANIKAGYEYTTSDATILGSGVNAEDSVDAFVLGLYTTY